MSSRTARVIHFFFVNRSSFRPQTVIRGVGPDATIFLIPDEEDDEKMMRRSRCQRCAC